MIIDIYFIIINMGDIFICNNCVMIHKDPKQYQECLGYCKSCREYWESDFLLQNYCNECSILKQICIYCGKNYFSLLHC
jgi:hypothetical protein